MIENRHGLPFQMPIFPEGFKTDDINMVKFQSNLQYFFIFSWQLTMFFILISLAKIFWIPIDCNNYCFVIGIYSMVLSPSHMLAVLLNIVVVIIIITKVVNYLTKVKELQELYFPIPTVDLFFPPEKKRGHWKKEYGTTFPDRLGCNFHNLPFILL